MNPILQNRLQYKLVRHAKEVRKRTPKTSTSICENIYKSKYDCPFLHERMIVCALQSRRLTAPPSSLWLRHYQQRRKPLIYGLVKKNGTKNRLWNSESIYCMWHDLTSAKWSYWRCDIRQRRIDVSRGVNSSECRHTNCSDAKSKKEVIH
jgi:hypothetical protein